MANVPLTVYKIWPDHACLMNVQDNRTRCQLWWILFRFLSVNECVNWELIYNQQYSSLVAMHDNQLKSLLCFLSWTSLFDAVHFILFSLLISSCPLDFRRPQPFKQKAFVLISHVIRVDIYAVFKFAKKNFSLRLIFIVNESIFPQTDSSNCRTFL